MNDLLWIDASMVEKKGGETDCSFTGSKDLIKLFCVKANGMKLSAHKKVDASTYFLASICFVALTLLSC